MTVARPLPLAALAIASAMLAGCGAHVAGVGGAQPGRGVCARPYADDSPWNRPIGEHARGRPAGLTQALSSDPTQYTYPVYEVSARTPLQAVRVEHWYSRVIGGGRRLVNVRGGAGSGRVVRVPIPPQAKAAQGSDAQAILVDRERGIEWDLSRLSRAGDGSYEVVNVGRYATSSSGVPPYDANGQPYFLRGAKIPYLAGLVRRCEIARGRISHALAFAFPDPETRWVYPATHSDGSAAAGAGLPMGTRLQLDPTVGPRTIRERWGCRGACFTIARALQRYGMYLIDGAGRSKVMVEYESTARWNGAVTEATPSAIPVDRLRIVAPPARR